MSKPETRTVRLWQIAQSEKAIQFRTMPPGDKTSRLPWFPRSVCHHISREAPDPITGIIPCVVEAEEWFLSKQDL